MRQDLALIQAYNFIKAKDYSSADEFIKLHYPKDDATLKPLNLEAQRLGFNIKPVRIEEKTKPTTPRKAPTYRFQDFIFRSDFYQCRYSGMKLFSTPALIAISLYIPDAFPVFKIPNLPLKRNHQGVWTVGPSLDHKESLYAGRTVQLHCMHLQYIYC